MHLVIGLPLLLSGEEGSQSKIVKETVKHLKKDIDIPMDFLDERYTTTGQKSALRADPDSTAACALLTVWMDRRNTIDI